MCASIERTIYGATTWTKWAEVGTNRPGRWILFVHKTYKKMVSKAAKRQLGKVTNRPGNQQGKHLQDPVAKEKRQEGPDTIIFVGLMMVSENSTCS